MLTIHSVSFSQFFLQCIPGQVQNYSLIFLFLSSSLPLSYFLCVYLHSLVSVSVSLVSCHMSQALDTVNSLSLRALPDVNEDETICYCAPLCLSIAEQYAHS